MGNQTLSNQPNPMYEAMARMNELRQISQKEKKLKKSVIGAHTIAGVGQATAYAGLVGALILGAPILAGVSSVAAFAAAAMVFSKFHRVSKNNHSLQTQKAAVFEELNQLEVDPQQITPEQANQFTHDVRSVLGSLLNPQKQNAEKIGEVYKKIVPRSLQNTITDFMPKRKKRKLRPEGMLKDDLLIIRSRERMGMSRTN